MKWKSRGLRGAALLCALLSWPAAAGPKKAPAEKYVPAPAEQIKEYQEAVLPCETYEDISPPRVSCEGNIFEGKSLRELAIMRNTIFARYGWDGYRKPWLREHFHKQPWFKPNPKFRFKLLSEADRKNVHFIAVREHSFSERELRYREAEVLARAGKPFDDAFLWRYPDGREVRACERPADFKEEWCEDGSCAIDHEFSYACTFQEKGWYTPDPKFTEAKLSAEDRIELGLISRALGHYASDSGKLESKAQASLDRVLSVKELRQLSLRDLRLLRNTIYARRGRPFKSKVLQAHFSALSWYKVDPGYTDARLTETDLRNVALIRSVEEEFGGALQDADWLIDPAVDVA
jgi:hypothetical protein